MVELYGLAAGPGTATGPAYRLAEPPRLPAPRPVSDVDAETCRAYAAIETVAVEIGRRAAAAGVNTTSGDILRAQAAMARDHTLRDDVGATVRAGHDAPHAVALVLAGHRVAFAAAGGVLAERVADLDDLRDRVIAACLGLPMPTLPEPGVPYVLIAVDVAPADAALLEPGRILGVVTADGSALSHTAIVTRSRGLPTVVGCAGVLDVPDGTVVTVDGTAGRVTVGGAAPVSPVRGPRVPRRRKAFTHPIALLANIGGVGDLRAGLDGVGLFRTELLFQHHVEPPTVDEQVATYAEVFEALPERPVTVRTLDAGADKPLPFLRGDRAEPNPALGVRGLRVARRRADVLHTQLTAIAIAARQSRAHVSVMAPMVATAAEAAGFATACRDAGLTSVGVMVEVPAAAVRARHLLGAVDFLSVGTNDLSQYTFAADRSSSDLADLLDPWQPALLALIALCADAGRAAGKPVSVCGEAAADPAYAVVLAGMGVTGLSMAPTALPAVREALTSHSPEACRRAAERALAADR